MFRPGLEVKKCPVCGSELSQTTIDQFGVPVGYSTSCDVCFKYNDIWVNGLRQVQCGEWESPDYESEYGTMTPEDKKQEKKILSTLNRHLLIERVKYMYAQYKEKKLYGEEYFTMFPKFKK